MSWAAVVASRRAAARSLRPLNALISEYASYQLRLDRAGAQPGGGQGHVPGGAVAEALHQRWASATAPGPPETITNDMGAPNGSAPGSLQLKKPTEPAPDECCGRGCVECIWTLYWDELKAYEAALADSEGRERPLDPFEALERKLAEQAAAQSQRPPS